MLAKTLTNRISQAFKGLPLRVILVVPFVLQISAAVGIVGYLSFKNGQQAVNDLAGQLRETATKQISYYLSDYLSGPQQINQINQEAIASGLLNLQDFERMGRLFWRQMQVFNVGYIDFANQEREFLGVERLDDGTLVLNEIRKNAPKKSSKYTVDDRGNRRYLQTIDDPGDVREEGWYADAAKAGRPVWTAIYQWDDKPVLSISSSYPIYDKDRKLLGVIGVDLVLSQIKNFLRTIPISPSSRTFILERNGLVVASSSDAPFSKIVDGKQKRLSALESSDPVVKSSAEFLKNKFNGLDQINGSHQLDFYLANTNARQFVQVTPWRDKAGLDWLVVVVVPESDFMAQINANTQTTILLCIAALAVAIVIGLITSQWIAYPIRRLSKTAAAIAEGKFDARNEIEGIKELEVLSSSFNQMAEELQDSFELLETRVDQRTVELKEAKQVAETANKTKSEFLANMSHELRTPLNAILGFTQVMGNDTSLNSEQQENLGIINRSGEHLLSLINDVLDMSKIEAGRVGLNEADFDLHRFLDTVEEMFQLKADSQGIELIVDHDPDVPQYIRSDERKLRQVSINLLGNAIKFTQKGSVSLRVKMGDDYINKNKIVATVEEQLAPYTLHFEVADTGPGIAPDELDSLFEPFIQTETGRNSQQGAGLGLPISRKFVQLLGGDITVSSELGKGTVFKFDIQVQPGEVADVQPPAPTRKAIGLAPGQPTYRILVADDRWANRRLMIKLLEPIGFAVCEAENGQEAVSLWESWEPHLIWMDMRMPIMDGYEAAKQIKSHLKGQATVIIALTASTLEEEKAVVLSAGCNDFVRKPFRAETIFEKMAQHLGVCYIYEEQVLPPDPPLAIAEKLTSKALTVMSVEWLAQLRLAAIELDTNRIDSLISQVSQEQASLATNLQKMAHNFDFDRILQLAEQAIALLLDAKSDVNLTQSSDIL